MRITLFGKNRQKCKECGFFLYILSICVFHCGAFPLTTKVTSFYAPIFVIGSSPYIRGRWLSSRICSVKQGFIPVRTGQILNLSGRFPYLLSYCFPSSWTSATEPVCIILDSHILRITLFGQYWPEMIRVFQSSCGTFQDTIVFSCRLRLFRCVLKYEFDFYPSIRNPGYLQFCIKGRPFFGFESGDLGRRRRLVSAGAVLFDALC